MALPPPDSESLAHDPPASLQALLERIPAPLEPLDVSMIDGYLCGVLLQPTPIPPNRWMPRVFDVDERKLPHGLDVAPIQSAVEARHAELAQAIARRDWFDPWIYELDESTTASEAVLPWVGGMALALETFTGLTDARDPRATEPLALFYRHFDPDDLEDVEPALAEMIEEIEPAEDLAEAVQDIVRAVMLLADVTRPLQPPHKGRPPGATSKRR